MTDSSPLPDTRSHEQRFLDTVLAVCERRYPGISARVERELVRDRAREAERAYVRPSNVTCKQWEASHCTMLEQMQNRIVNQVEALIAADAAALLGHPKPAGFDPVPEIRGGAAVARELTLAEEATPKEAAWEAVITEVNRLFKVFGDLPAIPRLAKAQAELAWRSAAASAGIGTGLTASAERKQIRELRQEIEDEGGIVG